MARLFLSTGPWGVGKIARTAMGPQLSTVQQLVSLPPKMAREFAVLEERPFPEWFAASDPPDIRLGSGGGTAHLLVAAWRAADGGGSFADWLRSSRKLIIHGAGSGRQLPAYAPTGKMSIPIPVMRWSVGQRLDQSLLDLQLLEYRRVLAHAGTDTVAMVTSGDVLVRFARDLPPFPAVDVLGLGMWVTPEVAANFGVFFCPRSRPQELAFFLQKPSPARIRQLARDHHYLVDTGVWLLSERAIRALIERCGWDEARGDFAQGHPLRYELYAEFGLALGRQPVAMDPLVRNLTSAVVPLPEARFYHFGTGRQMIHSVSALQNLELDGIKLGSVGAKRNPDLYVQNSRFDYPLRLETNHSIWVENSVIPAAWQLAWDHVLTGVPANEWDLRLPASVCLDFVPMGENEFGVRAYGIDDSFHGLAGEAATEWLGRSLLDWFERRGMTPASAGIDPGGAIQKAPLFPVLRSESIEPRFLEWLFLPAPEPNATYARQWVALPRVSAQALGEEANLARLYRQRALNRQRCLVPMAKNYRWSVFYRLDLESTARQYAATEDDLPPPVSASEEGLDPIQLVHDRMFRAAVLRHRAQSNWQEQEEQAFAFLRQMIVRDAQLAPVSPQRRILEDQIIWGRSPVRLDLAGGWTDTPPYCLEYGGRVVNAAVDLNGQPPIQVFAKLSPQPELVLRSIDLGIERRLRTYDELETYAEPGHEFALAKAALALAGFLPRFHAAGGYPTLEAQLRHFGGGIEISLLSAVPKGSGLGTSSILAATLLATLGELCGLNWDRQVLFARTLALEQMLTTGGGWQDQAGGIFRGIKLIETARGLVQKPTFRWLPEHLFEPKYANSSILLYYTGLTRLAKNILREIVRGMFLNSPSRLQVLQEIGHNAETAFQAIQTSDYSSLAGAIRTSWRLNQQLDSGTNTPEVKAILDPIADWLDAAKLLGAGGGGYFLFLAKDANAARCIRHELTEKPPNDRARFVDFSLSTTGLQLTRS